MLIRRIHNLNSTRECELYYSLRLSRLKNNSSDNIAVFPCCYAVNHGKPLYVFSYDEIMSSTNLFDQLSDIYYNAHEYEMFADCKEHIKLPINKCHFNNNKLKAIDISFLHSCNLNCKMCDIIHKDDEKIVKLYFKVLNDLKQHNISISLTQQGEPFFYKNEILNFFKELKSNDFDTIIYISNLTLLNDTDIELIHNSLLNTNINIYGVASIDGITEETYKKIRKNNLFNKVIHNAELLSKHKMLHAINFVVQDYNLHELIDAYQFWHTNHNLKFNTLVIYDPNDDTMHNRIINSETYKNFIKML